MTAGRSDLWGYLRVCPRILPDAVGHANLAISVVALAELRDGAELHPTRSDDIHADID